MKKRVCVLYTGGTIGMVATHHGYAPLRGHLQEALDAIPELLRPEIPDWDLLEFDPLLDSSDITAREWNQIGAAIRDNYAVYDGYHVRALATITEFSSDGLIERLVVRPA